MTTIAYLGPEHTNTHLAAQAKFGSRSQYRHEPTVDDVFTAVERDRAEYGVVPIENSLEGAVTHTLDRFIDFQDSPVKIHGEIEQPIRHYLIVAPDTELADIALVFSHPQALAQCRRWLARHVPHGAPRETNSTADAVRYVMQKKRMRAAVGRKELAQQYRLRAIPIPEERENRTRFLIISKHRPGKATRSKTSILLALKDRPGALYDALMPFKREGINLTKIESRPSKKKAWEYFFFIDFAGHAAELRVKRALKALGASTSLLRVLGSYPAAPKRGR